VLADGYQVASPYRSFVDAARVYVRAIGTVKVFKNTSVLCLDQLCVMSTDELAVDSYVAIRAAADRVDSIVKNPGIGLTAIRAQQNQTVLNLAA
jgi:hypothetical protein